MEQVVETALSGVVGVAVEEIDGVVGLEKSWKRRKSVYADETVLFAAASTELIQDNVLALLIAPSSFLTRCDITLHASGGGNKRVEPHIPSRSFFLHVFTCTATSNLSMNFTIDVLDRHRCPRTSFTWPAVFRESCLRIFDPLGAT